MTTSLTIHQLRGAKSLRLAFGATFFMLICVINLLGQSSHSVTDSRTPSGLEPGAPAGSFSLSGFDNINLYNGHLNFALPLIQVGGRGEAGYTITLPIERKWQSVSRTYYTDGRPHRSFNGEKFPRGTVFIARDGSATTFISDQAISDVACNDDDPAVRWGFKRIFPNGYLLFKNGVRYRVLSGRVMSIQDRNGNQVTFTGGGVVDSLGRTVLFNANSSITYKGFG